MTSTAISLRKRGRPSVMTEATQESILTRLAAGESLRSICRGDGMPDHGTVLRHVFRDADFRYQYELAREIQAESLVDEMLEIADDGRNDWMERNDPGNPGWIANKENVQRSRLRIDVRKWAAVKLLPKKYGDRVEVEHQPAALSDFLERVRAMAQRSALPVGPRTVTAATSDKVDD